MAATTTNEMDVVEDTQAPHHESPPASMSSFVAYCGRYALRRWPVFLVISFGFLLEMSFTAGVPLAFRYLIDHAIGEHRKDVLITVLAVMIVGVAVVSTTGLARDYLYARAATQMLGEMRVRMFERLQKLSMSYFARAQVGDILSRFSSDIAAVEGAVNAAIAWGILPALDVLVSTVLLFTIEPRLAAVTLLVFPLTLVGPRLVAPHAAIASVRRKDEESFVANEVHENVTAQPIVKAFGLEKVSMTHFRQRVAALIFASVRVSFLGSLLERSAGIGILILQVVVMGVGAWMAFNGTITIGALAAFQALFLTLGYSLSYVTQYLPNVVQAAGGMARIEELLTEKADVDDVPDAKPLARLHGTIEFDHVSFGYTKDKRTLENLSFTIKAGEWVSFVGPSGSGKSTVVNLVQRFYDPTSGAVKIDGVDLRSVSQESLRAQFGVVFQESFLFNQTIAENLRIGNPDATMAEIEEAAKQAEIHDIIMAMPDKYNTVVGERGGRLSGGQRQRIAIARALLRNPSVLILDEATAALDPASESAIHATMMRVAQGRTVLSVTHRMAQVVNSDRVIVLARGYLAEQGKHADLVKSGGLYQSLWEKQSGFVISDDGMSAAIEASRLKAIPMLSSLTFPALSALSTLFVTENVQAGKVIVQEGDPGDRLYILCRGSATVSHKRTRGGERQLGVFESGDFFGEIALLESSPRTATVKARTPCTLISLRREHFLGLLERSPALREILVKVAEERQRISKSVRTVAPV